MPPPTQKERLATAITRKEAVLILGTGVSVESSRNADGASWTSLLKAGIAFAKTAAPTEATDAWAAKVREEIDRATTRSLIAAAGDIEHTLDAPHAADFKRFFKTTVGDLKVANPALPNAIAALHKAGAVLATTNYDDLLKPATGLPPITWLEPDKIQEVLRRERDAIIHLHGHWDSTPSLVFGQRSYDATLRAQHAQALQTALTQFRSLVFIGSGDGLHDPNIGRLLEWLRNSTVPSTASFIAILCRDKDATNLTDEWRKLPGLNVIPYGKDYADLAPFLQSLIPSAPPATPPGPAPASTPLPPKPTRYHGRATAQAQAVATLLAAPGALLLHGSGGIGKTTLAHAILHDAEIEHRFDERRWHAALNTATNAETMASTVVRALGLDPAAHRIESALAHMAEAPGLLLLDNLETPCLAEPSATEALLARLARIPGLALLATYRGATPPDGPAWHTQPVGPVDDETAFAILHDHAPNIAATDPDWPPFRAALGGLPLAIDLIGRRARTHANLSVLWREWQAQGTRIAKRLGMEPSNLTSLDRSITLSADHASAPGLRLFALLGHLPSGIADADLSALLREEALDAREDLLRLGLAQATPGRLDLLPPIRRHAQVNPPPRRKTPLHGPPTTSPWSPRKRSASCPTAPPPSPASPPNAPPSKPPSPPPNPPRRCRPSGVSHSWCASTASAAPPRS